MPKTIVNITPRAVEHDSRTFKEAASLARLGYRSLVVESQPSRMPRNDLPFQLISLLPRVHQRSWFGPVALTGAARTSYLRSLLDLYDFTTYYLRQVWLTLRVPPRADLYYLHSYNQFPPVYLLCRLRRVPFIYDAHDFYSQGENIADKSPFERLAAVIGSWLERLCLGKAAAVVTVADGIADLYLNYCGRRPVVLPNADDPRLAEPNGPDLRQVLGLGPEVFLFVVVGMPKMGQSLEEAFHALLGLPQHVHLALVGGGSPNLEERVASLALGERVHVLPPVPADGVSSFIGSADAALVLYHARSNNYLYALPNRFFQSVSAGLPLIYPLPLPEIARIAQAHDLGLGVDPQSPQSLASAMARLVGDPDLLASYRRNVRAAAPRLSWETQEPLLADVVARVLSGSRL